MIKHPVNHTVNQIWSLVCGPSPASFVLESRSETCFLNNLRQLDIFQCSTICCSNTNKKPCLMPIAVDSWGVCWLMDTTDSRWISLPQAWSCGIGSWTFHQFGVLQSPLGPSHFLEFERCSNHLDLEYSWSCDSINLQQATCEGCVWFEIVALLLGPFGN